MYGEYSSIDHDDMGLARSREKKLISRSIELLEKASQSNAGKYEQVEALHFTSRIWTALLDDLARDDNQLPAELRASIISIGIWIIKETEAIRQGRSEDFDGIIDISGVIMEGLT